MAEPAQIAGEVGTFCATHAQPVVSESGKQHDALRAEVHARYDSLHREIGAMQRTMVQFAAVLVAALVGLFAAQLGVILL